MKKVEEKEEKEEKAMRPLLLGAGEDPASGSLRVFARQFGLFIPSGE